jgi:hypothetical protein
MKPFRFELGDTVLVRQMGTIGLVSDRMMWTRCKLYTVLFVCGTGGRPLDKCFYEGELAATRSRICGEVAIEELYHDSLEEDTWTYKTKTFWPLSAGRSRNQPLTTSYTASELETLRKVFGF